MKRTVKSETFFKKFSNGDFKSSGYRLISNGVIELMGKTYAGDVYFASTDALGASILALNALYIKAYK